MNANAASSSSKTAVIIHPAAKKIENVPLVAAVSQASKQLLTYQNGFYTLKPTAGVLPHDSLIKQTVFTTENPIQVRTELSQVQLDLRKNLHLHQMLLHKIKLLNANSTHAAPTDLEVAKQELKVCEERITFLKEQQLQCVTATRESFLAQTNRSSQKPIFNNFNRPKKPELDSARRKTRKQPDLTSTTSPLKSVVEASSSSKHYQGDTGSSHSPNTTVNTFVELESKPLHAECKTEPPGSTEPEQSTTNAASSTLTIPLSNKTQSTAVEKNEDSKKAVLNSNKPHLLSKPVSVSPVPPCEKAIHKYTSLQDYHLSLIKPIISETDDTENKNSIEFMAALDLITPKLLNQIQQKKLERKRRVRMPSNKFLESIASEPKASSCSSSQSILKRPRRVPKRQQSPSPVPLKKPCPKVPDSSEKQTSHDDYCAVCMRSGELLLCDTCTHVYHLDCLGLKSIPEGTWSCPKCVHLSKPKTVLPITNKPNSTALDAVRDYVTRKVEADVMKSELLKQNADLVAKNKVIKDSVKQLNIELQQKSKNGEQLKETTQHTRSALIATVEWVKALRSCTNGRL